MAPTNSSAASSRLLLASAAAIVIVTLVCFGRVMHFDFVNYDDNKYITMNPVVVQGLTIEGAKWAFETFTLANWHPLTWMSHMLDVELFELDAGLHHLVNVIIHAANAVLLLILLHRMTRDVWRSAFVSALFAVHPLHVESVAWISERKDVLSTLFGLLAMLAYVRWVGVPNGEPRRRGESLLGYSAVVACLALSLLCKPMLVTLPFVLLLLDIWPLQRPWKWNLVAEKLPLLTLSIASSMVTVIAQERGGAIAQLDSVPLSGRIANAIVSYAAYIRQMFWPVDLAPMYPLPPSWPPAAVLASASALLVVTIIAYTFALRKRFAPLIGWLWYLGTLVPVIGLVQVGSQARADRYTYFPLIGLFIMIAWCIPNISRDNRLAVSIRNSLIGAAFIACAFITWNQVGYWRDSITLSRHVIAVTGENAVAEFNLANALVEADRTSETIAHFIAAAEIRTNWADPENNLGNAYLRLQQPDEAIAAYQRALDRQPRHPQANKSLGMMLAQRGSLDLAAQHLAVAIESMPDDAVARMFYATVLRDLGQTEEARRQFQQAAADAQRMGDGKLLAEIQRRLQTLSAPAK